MHRPNRPWGKAGAATGIGRRPTRLDFHGGPGTMGADALAPIDESEVRRVCGKPGRGGKTQGAGTQSVGTQSAGTQGAGPGEWRGRRLGVRVAARGGPERSENGLE